MLAHYGQIDLLINNAVYQDRETNAMLLDTDDAALERTLYGNVVAPLRLVRRVLPSMLARGGGQIINVSSGAGKNDPPAPANRGGWGFAYGASKAALARMSGCVNREHGAQGIRAFSVNPGVVATEALTATLGEGGELERRYGAMKPARSGPRCFGSLPIRVRPRWPLARSCSTCRISCASTRSMAPDGRLRVPHAVCQVKMF